MDGRRASLVDQIEGLITSRYGRDADILDRCYRLIRKRLPLY
jgi:hypothetical protein